MYCIGLFVVLIVVLSSLGESHARYYYEWSNERSLGDDMPPWSGGLRCSIKDADGNEVSTKACPGGLSCGGTPRLEYFNGTLALISRFCEMPPPPPKPEICRITDMSDKTLFENACAGNGTCTGDAQDDFVTGHQVQIYVCVFPAPPLPKLCRDTTTVCTTYYFYQHCYEQHKYYVCADFPTEITTTQSPPTSREYVCGVQGAVSGDCSKAGEECSRGEVPAVLANGLVVHFRVCMLAQPEEVYIPPPTPASRPFQPDDRYYPGYKW